MVATLSEHSVIGKPTLIFNSSRSHRTSQIPRATDLKFSSALLLTTTLCSLLLQVTKLRQMYVQLLDVNFLCSWSPIQSGICKDLYILFTDFLNMKPQGVAFMYPRILYTSFKCFCFGSWVLIDQTSCKSNVNLGMREVYQFSHHALVSSHVNNFAKVFFITNLSARMGVSLRLQPNMHVYFRRSRMSFLWEINPLLWLGNFHPKEVFHFTKILYLEISAQCLFNLS